MEPAKTNISLAIWDCAYTLEKKTYNDLIVKKALRLKALQDKDLFAIPEIEVKSVVKQIDYITSELNILYAFKLFTDQLEKSYLTSIDQIFEAYHYRNLLLEMELYQLYKAHSFLQEMNLATIESLSFMTDLVIQRTEQIITLKQKP